VVVLGLLFEKSGSVASGAVNLNEIVEDTKALSRVWELYGGLIRNNYKETH
jgi:hypothetical protein